MALGVSAPNRMELPLGKVEKDSSETMRVTHVDLVYGQSAHTLLGDPRYLALWRALHDECPHATVFQAPNFVCAWYGAYRAQWQPVVIQSRDSKGDLVGLWLLAHNPVTDVVAHAGTHQAEYHVWLALPGFDVSFLSAAWIELNRRFAGATLRFKYLPAGALGDTLQTAIGTRSGGVVVRKHSRPLINLDPEEIKKSFAKKSNKSRFNRLKKLGKIEFRRLVDSAELERVFDDLIAYYDFRQSAVNHSMPFGEDPQKRAFHSELFTVMPGEMYVTATYLDERPIAAFWGAVSGKTVHLGMLIYSPFLAEHSPGKLHMMQLSEHLLKEGKNVLDLTPGGDPWKERFANAHDEVAEAIVYGSAGAQVQDVTLDRLLQWGKWCSALVGVTPANVKSALAMLRRVRPTTVIRKIRNWSRMDREFRIYRGDRALAESFRCDERVHHNSLSHLLSFEPGEPWQSRDTFLSNALARLEHGEVAYTISIDNRLAHCGWMVKNQGESHMTEVKQSMTFPQGSVALYDFYSQPGYRGQGLYRATIGHMMREAFADAEIHHAYISVLADNLPSLHVIETMGFEYQGSLFLKRRFGTERTWASPMLNQIKAACA